MPLVKHIHVRLYISFMNENEMIVHIVWTMFVVRTSSVISTVSMNSYIYRYRYLIHENRMSVWYSLMVIETVVTAMYHLHFAMMWTAWLHTVAARHHLYKLIADEWRIAFIFLLFFFYIYIFILEIRDAFCLRYKPFQGKWSDNFRSCLPFDRNKMFRLIISSKKWTMQWQTVSIKRFPWKNSILCTIYG